MTLLSKLDLELKAYSDPVFFCNNILHIKPYRMQAEILRKFYMTDPPDIYTHMVLVCGMRSGKTQLGAMASTYELFKLILKGNPQKYYDLPPGQPIYILHVANSREQAKNTIFSQTAGLLEHADWFADHGLQERHNEFSFPDYGLVLACEHSNSAALAGRTAKAVILDETARFKDTAGKYSGAAVYYTVSRAVKTFGNEGKVFSVSSPISVDDFQMQLYTKGQKLKNFLCYKKATWEMNPRITQASLKPEFLLNPETAWRDYGAIPSMSQEAYFGNQYAINEAFDSSLPHIIEDGKLIDGLMPKSDTFYFLAGDPAVKNDAFGLCLLHQEDNSIIVDFVHRFIQQDITEGGNREIDAFKVKDFILNVADIYPLRSFMVDTWQFPETIQAMEHAGVYVKQHTVKKQEYDCLKEQIYTHNIKIPVSGKLNEELKQLELLHGTRIDHPKTGCLAGSTKIPLLDGRDVDIKTIINEVGHGKELWTYSIGDGRVIPKRIIHPRLTREQAKVMKIVLDNNEELVCTPDHPIMVRDGTFKQAEDLQVGESLMPFYRRWHQNGPLDDYEMVYSPLEDKWHYTHRAVVGKQAAGMIVHHNNFNKLDNTPPNLQPMSRTDHTILHNRHPSIGERQKKSETVKRWHVEHRGTDVYKLRSKRISMKIQNNNKNSKKTIKRLAKETMIADGTYDDYLRQHKIDTDKRRSETLKILHKEHPEIWENSRKALHAFNLSERGRKLHSAAMHRLLEKVRAGEIKRTNWAEGLTVDDPRIKKFVEAGANAQRGVSKSNRKLNHKVKSITMLDEPQDVYDLSIDGTENFPVTSGIFVHNSKDMADAVANAVWELVQETGIKPEVWRTPTKKGRFYGTVGSLPQLKPIDEEEFHEFDIY